MEEHNNKPRVGIARKVARKLLEDANVNIPPVIIRDIINFLKKEIDISVRPWAFGDNTDGIQITKEKLVVIGYNNLQHQHRQRFTVAHELGHLLLGHTNKNYDFDINSGDPEEIEANQFAGELLVPLKMLKEDMKKGNKSIEFIVNNYNVSKEVAWLRLLNLKLISKL